MNKKEKTMLNALRKLDEIRHEMKKLFPNNDLVADMKKPCMAAWQFAEDPSDTEDVEFYRLKKEKQSAVNKALRSQAENKLLKAALDENEQTANKLDMLCVEIAAIVGKVTADADEIARTDRRTAVFMYNYAALLSDALKRIDDE